MQAVRGPRDHAARIGGEEFALVLPGVREERAFHVAERLRRAVRNADPESSVRLSISFGVTAYPRYGATADELLQTADQALYVAKRLGRDRSVTYSAEVASSLRAGLDLAPMTADQLPAVLVLAETLDLRDTGTCLHSQSVGRYAEAIAARLGFASDHVERVRLAGVLHDVGKIGVADQILQKPGRLDAEEWAGDGEAPGDRRARPGRRQPR